MFRSLPPPYNRIRNDTYDFYDDTLQDYYKFILQITDELLRLSRKQVIVNIQANHFNKTEVYKYIGHYAENMKGIIIWEKTNPQPASNFKNDEYSITNAYEFFFVLGKDNEEFRAYNKIKNVISTAVNSEHFEGHGAVMKKEVADWFIANFTKKGDTVLDCFMGCGTTAVSCRDLGRKYIGFEIAKEYCEISENRLSQIVMDL
jgi:DNA modification methylase